MSCLSATEEAISIIETLKRCILKQDQCIKNKDSELESLRSRVKILERENKELNEKLKALKVLVSENEYNPSQAFKSDNESCGNEKSPQELTNHDENENVTKETKRESIGPVITITSDGTAQSPDHTPIVKRHDTMSRSIRRNESVARKRSFSDKYELSPDLHDKSIKFLEKRYGGKERAHWAARVIQLNYRKYAMNQRFTRMRTFSDHAPKGLQSFVAKSEDKVATATLETPVGKFKRNNSMKIKRRSMLVIDNLSGVPSSLLRTDANSKLSSQDELKEQEVVKTIEDNSSENKSHKETVSESQTEYYVKVEIMENLESSPASVELETIDESQTGVLPNEFGESDYSGREMNDEMNDVDSIDGSCVSSHIDVDYDTRSTSSEMELYQHTNIKPQKLETRIGIGHFNRKPEKGINYLIGQNVLENDPENVARFLLSEPGISKQKLGEYLGNLQNTFNMDVLKHFVQALDFTGMEIDQALRLFQTQFRMPGEAQKIERLMEAFAGQYVACNPSQEENVQDIVLILAFAIVMLNTDLHSPNVKKRMTEEEFIINLRGTNNGKDFPREILKQIYLRVLKKEFVPGKDHVSFIEKLEKKIVGKCPWTRLAVPQRQLRQLTPLFEVRDPNKKEKLHQRIVLVFNDKVVITKERGKAGQPGGFHLYSYKHAFSLAGVKVLTFSNDFYLHGIQLYSKLESKVVALFNAKDEQTRKVFVDELLECIEETNVMEGDRIKTEKQKKFVGRRNVGNRIDSVPGVYNTMPRRPKRSTEYSRSPDTISLIDTSIDSLSISNGGLYGNKVLSSSLLNISDADSSYASEGSMVRSSSSGSLDSAFVDGETFRHIPEGGIQASPPQRKKSSSIFGKWRTRTTSKMSVRTSPLLSESRTSAPTDLTC